ncbi:hypothetical protein PL11201_680213 [Planktothrix sp. PCC 11201]|nr:hypothetical protein PL11201_680213 [Planktothrix sp. PCC 11201]
MFLDNIVYQLLLIFVGARLSRPLKLGWVYRDWVGRGDPAPTEWGNQHHDYLYELLGIFVGARLSRPLKLVWVYEG